MDIYHNYK